MIDFFINIKGLEMAYNNIIDVNEVKENSKQHKNQDSNLFLKTLNYLNPSSLFLTLIIFVFVGTGFWATFTELDEVIRCSGQVVPASNAKVIQSEFQGKVSSINFKVGDNVKVGDILLTLKDSDFVTEININKEDYFSSLALIDRLEGESNFKKPIFNTELKSKRPDLMNAQLQVYNARFNKLKDSEKLFQLDDLSGWGPKSLFAYFINTILFPINIFRIDNNKTVPDENTSNQNSNTNNVEEINFGLVGIFMILFITIFLALVSTNTILKKKI